jgi:polysaccharide chain length determinant protein (PEP-CTERM system associated)
MDENQAPDAELVGREIHEYLEIPLRYRRAMWLPFSAVFALAVLAFLLVPAKYRSATLILVEHTDLPEHFVTPVSSESIAQRLQTIRQVVLSRTNLESVIEELHPYPELANLPSYLVVENMRRAIEIRVHGDDSFSLEYVNRTPETAMAVTNRLAERFIENADRIRESLTQRAYAFIESNLGDARKELEAREAALRQSKQRYWGSLPEQLASNLAVLQQLQVEQQTVGESLRTLEERRSALERSVLEGRRVSTPGGGALAELAALKAEHQKLRNRYTDQHPEVVALQLRIQRLEEQLARGEATTATQADPDLASAYRALQLVEAEIEGVKTKREQLDQKIGVYQARVEQTPKAEQELLALTRDYEQLRENYTSMLRKQMDAEMARKMEQYWRGGTFRILDPAHLPRRPIRPYAGLILLGGLALALATGVASALLADFLDRSLKTERDVETFFPYPILVSVPRVASTGRAGRR